MGGELLKTTVSSNPGILQKKTHHNIDSIRVVTCHVIFYLKKKNIMVFSIDLVSQHDQVPYSERKHG